MCTAEGPLSRLLMHKTAHCCQKMPSWQTHSARVYKCSLSKCLFKNEMQRIASVSTKLIYTNSNLVIGSLNCVFFLRVYQCKFLVQICNISHYLPLLISLYATNQTTISEYSVAPMVFIIFDSGVSVMVNRHHVCNNSTNYQEVQNHDKRWVNTSKQVLA